MPRPRIDSEVVEPLQRRAPNPALPSPARFMVGPDGHGGWIVQDRLGRTGGLFANETAAVHFAREECDRNPADICHVPEGVLLGFDVLKTESVH